MGTTQFSRARRLITMIVVTALLLAPTASWASCCCILAKIGRSAGLLTVSCCGDTTVPTCCASRGVEGLPVKSICCSGRVGVNFATMPQSDTTQSTHPAPLQCDCQRSSCDRVNASVVAINSESDLLRIGQDLTSEASISSTLCDFIPAAVTLGKDHTTRYLSAPHRCATLCRWLK